MSLQPPSSIWEYSVLPMVSALATMHRLTPSIFCDLSHAKTFYDDTYVVTKSQVLGEHLSALRQVFEGPKQYKLNVTIANCVLCKQNSVLGQLRGPRRCSDGSRQGSSNLKLANSTDT
ncbi:TPA: hypothetical protein N0F65_009667 [Lagenidium giganteum]|uniref:Uncharacterized protein n=1 Tax=Lagenidium giganteum TaxID=4803 RepID=A0AAV2YTQ7_9STRA|nr:TPA: hypothetical protein N0F65_009667 [Lagenidium giganteum]